MTLQHVETIPNQPGPLARMVLSFAVAAIGIAGAARPANGQVGRQPQGQVKESGPNPVMKKILCNANGRPGEATAQDDSDAWQWQAKYCSDPQERAIAMYKIGTHGDIGLMSALTDQLPRELANGDKTAINANIRAIVTLANVPGAPDVHPALLAGLEQARLLERDPCPRVDSVTKQHICVTSDVIILSESYLDDALRQLPAHKPAPIVRRAPSPPSA